MMFEKRAVNSLGDGAVLATVCIGRSMAASKGPGLCFGSASTRSTTDGSVDPVLANAMFSQTPTCTHLRAPALHHSAALSKPRCAQLAAFDHGDSESQNSNG